MGLPWWVGLIIIFGSLLMLMATGLPVAFCFMAVVLIGIPLWWSGTAGLNQFILSIRNSLASFTLVPIPLFILMGEIMFRSGVAPQMISALDKWLGRMPGRLSLLTIGGGAIFATMSGSSVAAVALLGKVLLPDMLKRGYKNQMILGPIMASGCLSVMIPPSGIAVVLGNIAEVSIAGILIAIIMPGLLMAALMAAYVIGRAKLQPKLAPAYDIPPLPLSAKLIDTLRYIFPLTFIVFAIIGVMLLGIASATEAAATGALATLILSAVYRRLNWNIFKQSLVNTIDLSVMILLIISAATAFSQILVFSGAGQGLSGLALNAPFVHIVVVIAMLVVVLILGMFMNSASIIMICIPIFIPIIPKLGFDPLWFCVAFLLCAEMGALTPPFGINLFAMKGVAPSEVTFGDCVRNVIPFIVVDLIALALIVSFPIISLWLPGLMR